MLPEHFHFRTETDLLIIMGSSLVVQPFASLINRVRPNYLRLLINKDKVDMQDQLSRHNFIFATRNSHGGRNIAWLSNCDTYTIYTIQY